MKHTLKFAFVVLYLPIWFVAALIALCIGIIASLAKFIDDYTEKGFKYLCVILLMATRGKEGAIKTIKEAAEECKRLEAEHRKEQK